MGGTSQAAPHVAGAIALLREAAPTAKLRDLSDWIVRSYTSIADNRGTKRLYPRLDVVAVLAGDVVDLFAYDAVADADTDGDGLAEAGEHSAMLVSVENDGPGELGPFRMGVATDDADLTVTKAAGTMSAVGRMGLTTAHGFEFDVSPACDTDHDATFTATIYDADGNTNESTFTLFIRCETDADKDGYPWSTDCDESRADVHPDADEVCNGRDDNCDTIVDTDAIDAASWYADGDADGFGDPAAVTVSCTAPTGSVSDNTDCDDTSADISPSTIEVCNTADDNCDGEADEGGVCTVADAPPETKRPADAGCGCSPAPSGVSPAFLLLGLVARRRRRERPA